MSALTDIFTAIANAIRGKNGTQNTYTPSQMAQAITDIPSGGEGLELVACRTNSSSEYTVFYFLKEDVESALNIAHGATVPNIAWGYAVVLGDAGNVTSFLEMFITEAYVGRYTLRRNTSDTFFTLLDNNNNIRTNIIILRDVYIPFKVMLKKVTVTVNFNVTVSVRANKVYWWISAISMQDDQGSHISSVKQSFYVSNNNKQSTNYPMTNGIAIEKGNTSASGSMPTQPSTVSYVPTMLYVFHGRALKTTVSVDGLSVYSGTFTFDDYILE